MPSRQFAFFSMMIAWDLMISRATGLDEISILVFPLVVIVCGWRLFSIFLIVDVLLDLPNIILRIPAMLSVISSLRFLTPSKLNSTIGQYLPLNSSAAANASPEHIPPDLVFPVLFIILITCGVALFVILRIEYRVIRMYISILRRCSEIAKRWGH